MKEKCFACGLELDIELFYERPGPGRSVSYDCKACRKKKRDRHGEYVRARVKEFGEPCIWCGVARKDLVDGECRKCLTKRGMKKCCSCGLVKLVLLDFWSKRNKCTSCCKSLDREPKND